MTETATISEQPADADPDATSPAVKPRRRRFREWLTDRPRTEVLAWGGLLLVALFLRWFDLGDRPFHHDESQDAYFSYTFFKDFGSYEYNPLLHGPLRFYLTGFLYWIFEPTNFTARLAPSLMGLLAVGLPYLLRHQIGRIAAFSAAVLLAIGPSFLYFSRFAREDIYLAAIMLALIVAAFRFLRRPHAVTLCLFTALIALAFATKESGIVLAFIVCAYLLVAMIVQGVLARRRGGSFGDGEIAGALLKVRWTSWVYAVATFAFVYVLLFTQFFTNFDCTTTATELSPAKPTSCVNALWYGLDYWRDQQPIARGGDSAWLYFTIIFGEEWPVMILGIVGAFFALRRPTTLRVFLVVYFVSAMAFHMWGKERFAWLVLHPLLPLILLAGVGAQGLWEARRTVVRRGAVAFGVIGFAYLAFASFTANSTLRAQPESLLVSTQSSEQVRQVAEQVEALGDVTVTVDSAEGATFPYAWYFRDNQIGYIDASADGYVPDSQALVLTDTAHTKLQPNLAAYDCRKFDFRVWWVKDYGKKFSPSAWWDWLTKREAWNTTGGMQEWFCVRSDVGPLPGKGTKTDIPPPESA